jgi:hypothetical protein
MLDESNPALPMLFPAHVCTRCGGVSRREALEGRMHLTGIFRCPKCGAEGPLNLEIREPSDFEPGP